MPIEGVSRKQRTFELLRRDLGRSDPGGFAVVCGDRLLGVYGSVDEALQASARAFDARTLPEGAPVLINEIAARMSVRVKARSRRRAGRARGAVAGEM